MGKFGNKRGGRGGGRFGGGGGNRRPRYDNRAEVPKTNELLEEYYNDLGIVEESEKDEFWSALRRELPNSFRFTGSKGQALPVQQLLKDRYIPEITAIEYEGQPVTPPTAIPWFPDQLAWQMTTPKNIVRKFPPFASFQKFLVSETTVGNISRQEVVSMIPPLVMDVKPGMTVLDLCAAPGSKAAQLIEMVHGGEEARMRKVIRRVKQDEGREASPEGDALQEEMEDVEEDGDWSDDGRATGLLIANDVEYKRAHMLTHQMKRLNSPNLIVTNHDATMYPSIKLPSENGSNNKYLKFDRILADVPCSGDGTTRKNISIWKDWIPGNALGLFSTQMRILVRALQMLKVGGRVVYSTCSMNPVENEAVVAAAIERCCGLSKVDVLDCSDALPGLKRKAGLTRWKVMDKHGRTWKTWGDVEQERAERGEEGLGRLSEGMFPPTGEAIPLERCMRVYPHMQDTGAFFITVLEKKIEIKAKPESTPAKAELQSSSIVDVVNNIEQKPQPNGTDPPLGKIDALDSIAPITNTGEAEDTSAAARQNKENAPSTSTTATKRSFDASADAEMSTKRPKIRDEVDDPAPQGAEDRQVHWPPPPGAVLDASRPETTTSIPSPPPPAATPQPQPTATTTSPTTTNNANPSTARHTDAVMKKRPHVPYEEPFKYLPPTHPDLASIANFYHLSPHFPFTRFMVRNALGVPSKTIYYTSALAKDILTANANSGIKFVHCGVKMFVKQDVQGEGVCRWRIQSEGLPILEAWVGEERCVRLWRRETLRALLVEMFPKVEGGGWRQLGEIGERVRDVGMGCCVLRVEKGGGNGDGEGEGFAERMTLPLWRSLHSLNLMLPKEDRKAMLLRLFGEVGELMDHSKERFERRGREGGQGEKGEGRVKEGDQDEEEEKKVGIKGEEEGDEAAESPLEDEDAGGGVVLKDEVVDEDEAMIS